jgi:hypothetical protein
MGTATLIYTSDYDDYFPLGLTLNSATGLWRRTGGHAIPAGWIVTSRYIPEEDAVGVTNSTEPYRKNYDMLVIPGESGRLVSGLNYNSALRAPKDNSLAYNGLIQAYSTTAVEAVSKLTMWWQGWGRAADKGVAYINPRLNCRSTTPGPCVFNPSNYPMANMTDSSQRGDEWNSDSTMWIHNRGAVFVFTDSSAKWRRLAANAGLATPSGNGNDDPLLGLRRASRSRRGVAMLLAGCAGSVPLLLPSGQQLWRQSRSMRTSSLCLAVCLLGCAIGCGSSGEEPTENQKTLVPEAKNSQPVTKQGDQFSRQSDPN